MSGWAVIIQQRVDKRAQDTALRDTRWWKWSKRNLRNVAVDSDNLGLRDRKSIICSSTEAEESIYLRADAFLFGPTVKPKLSVALFVLYSDKCGYVYMLDNFRHGLLSFTMQSFPALFMNNDNSAQARFLTFHISNIQRMSTLHLCSLISVQNVKDGSLNEPLSNDEAFHSSSWFTFVLYNYHTCTSAFGGVLSCLPATSFSSAAFETFDY